MVNKKVTCYSVNIPESMDFVQLLLDNEESSLKPFVLDQYRTIELKYTQIQKNGSIVGLFVTTSRKNIPPAHKPGNGDDYTALPLDDGQGLAYPNVFLYDPQFKVLYLETNRMGVSPSKICAYFEARAIRDSIPTFWIDFRFSIEEPIIASNLQFMDRKNGINTVYMKLYKEVSTVVDSIQRLRKE